MKKSAHEVADKPQHFTVTIELAADHPIYTAISMRKMLDYRLPGAFKVLAVTKVEDE